MTLDAYLSIPYRSQGRDASGCDCWGLLRLVYADVLGIDLKSFADVPATSLRDVARLIARHKAEWIKVERPARFDAVILKTVGGEKASRHLDAHVGIAVDHRRFLHTEAAFGPRVERFDGPVAKHRIVEFRRHTFLSLTLSPAGSLRAAPSDGLAAYCHGQ